MTRKEFLLLSKGDKIRIADKWPENPLNVWRNSEGLMDKWLGKEVTVHDVLNDFDDIGVPFSLIGNTCHEELEFSGHGH